MTKTLDTGPDERRLLAARQWAVGQARVKRDRMIHRVVQVVVVGAVVLAVAAFLRPSPKAPPVEIPGPTTGPEGIAELYVAGWLANPGGDSFAAFWPGQADLGSRPPQANNTIPPTRVLRTVATDVREITPTYWSVIVGVVSSAGDAAATTRFFRVPIMRTEAKVYVAAALPAETTAPLGSRSPSLAVGGLARPEPDDPMAAAINRFLGALLAGQGELSRYTVAGAHLQPVRPSPYTSVEITGMARRELPAPPEQHFEVFVTAAATDSAGRVFPLAYPLELAARDRQWVVVAPLAAPSLPDEQPDLTPPTVATTTAVPTTIPTTTTTIRRIQP